MSDKQVNVVQTRQGVKLREWEETVSLAKDMAGAVIDPILKDNEVTRNGVSLVQDTNEEKGMDTGMVGKEKGKVTVVGNSFTLVPYPKEGEVHDVEAERAEESEQEKKSEPDDAVKILTLCA